MHFSKLRLVGFKSFVEPTDFEIHPGLTGIIGPNGCGKSNLVEALRWVMGETSYKSMRGAGMDDVIFAGGGARPARNVAEVGLTLDNSARTAPASFNDADVLEITRRIEREQGSTYRINGREVRARDVQILFADASTGARSPALVRQGQIAEIIAAKPQARRRILEDAAGVAGLHTRRHEAELRLKGAEDNLARIDDVLTQIDGQSDALRRQARQADRYRDLQAELRRQEALALLIEWEACERDAAAADAARRAAEAEVVACTRDQGEAARHQAVAAHALPALRDGESEASAALQNVLVARQTLEGEERRAKGRRDDLARRIDEMSRDLARDAAAREDAEAALARLAVEASELAARESTESAETALRDALADTARRRTAAEARLADAHRAWAEAEARRRALDERVRDDTARLARAERDLAQAQTSARALSSEDGKAKLETARAKLADAAAAADAAEAESRDADRALAALRAAESSGRTPLVEADRAVQRLETEVRTLAKLLEGGAGGRWPKVVDALRVDKGFEAALGAALGDDLEASADTRAPAHWAGSAGDDPALPDAARPLSTHVQGPAALHRRLAQIGVVKRADGPKLRARLMPGQRLVSREGDLWRWDGFTQAAEAPAPAAQRLAERNRLADLRGDAVVARQRYDALKTEADRVQAELRAAAQREAAARTAAQAARRTLDAARDAQAALERRDADAAARRAQLAAADTAARSARDDAATRTAAGEAALAALAPAAGLVEGVEIARHAAEIARAEETEARTALAMMARDRETHARRLAAVAEEQASWRARAAGAETHHRDVADRIAEAQREAAELAEAPDRFILARRQILAGIDAAETALRAASDARARGETVLAEADRLARKALDAMAGAREAKARTEAQAAAAADKRDGVARTVAADLACDPGALPVLAGIKAADPRPAAEHVAARIEALKADRDRLGAVNLRAAEELAAMEVQRSSLDAEKGDLTEAIRRLRQAITSLNRDGRERLLKAFDAVNGHFRDLFTTLFGGGTAELQLIESDDPLEAGLEIVARPPGKKPQVMTLLSGGEQALTAISLIFAVFLTNPSPICVLDEVDAPLDDANVERFCDLVDAMRSKTETRFIAITHNPISMARMDRLYGVTQAEQGISQLVSVDLAAAERLLDAS